MKSIGTDVTTAHLCTTGIIERMKAILVIDMPVSLENLIGKELGMHLFEKESEEYISTEYAFLKPLPDRQKVKAGAGGYTRGFTAGFNKFRYLIAGEENEDESNISN